MSNMIGRITEVVVGRDSVVSIGRVDNAETFAMPTTDEEITMTDDSLREVESSCQVKLTGNADDVQAVHR